MSIRPFMSQGAQSRGFGALRRLVLPEMWRQRWWLAAGLSALVVVDLIQLIAPRLTGQAIDRMQLGGDLWPLLLGLIGVAVGVSLLRFVWRICLIGASRRVRRALRARLYERVLLLGPEARGRWSSGDLITRATADVDAIGMACGFGLLAAVDAAVMICLVSLRVPAVGGSTVIWALLPLPLMALWVVWAGRVIHTRFEAVQASSGVMSEEARELLAAARYVKGSGLAVSLRSGFERANDDARQQALGLAKINAWFDPGIAALAGLAQAILFWRVGGLVIDGELPLGAAIELAGYLALLTWPMQAIGWSVNLLQRGSVAAYRLAEVVEAPEGIETPASPRPLAEEQTIATQGLDLDLGGRRILSDISIELRPGELVGLVGASGSGKSSLLRCLARLLPVPAGTLRYGGLLAEELDPAAVRGRVALAAQEPVLFGLTVRDNIALADPQASEAQVQAAARAAGIHDEILALRDGYETLLGERGLTLSGGQRARVGLARALLAPTPIILLDDCLAAVDGDRAAAIVAGLRRAVAGRGGLVVAHRLATVVHCDRILVLDSGRIVESGNHAALLALGGRYARTWALQHGEHAAEPGDG